MALPVERSPVDRRVLGSDSPLTAASQSTAKRRLAVFAQLDDGFALAEEDLKIRGPGQVLGVAAMGGDPIPCC